MTLFRCLVNFKVEASAEARVGTNLSVCHSDVLRMNCIGLQRCLISKGAVEHNVGIRRVESSINIHRDAEQPGYAASQALETCLDVLLHTFFLFCGKVFPQPPQYDML